jgi:hypothetical protein
MAINTRCRRVTRAALGSGVDDARAGHTPSMPGPVLMAQCRGRLEGPDGLAPSSLFVSPQPAVSSLVRNLNPADHRFKLFPKANGNSSEPARLRPRPPQPPTLRTRGR